MRLGTVTNLTEDGRVGDRLIAHYRTVARGGAATLVTEALRVHESNVGEGLPTFRADTIPGFARLAESVHAEGALAGGHIVPLRSKPLVIRILLCPDLQRFERGWHKTRRFSTGSAVPNCASTGRRPQ